jgi:hypothetical protein
LDFSCRFVIVLSYDFLESKSLMLLLARGFMSYRVANTLDAIVGFFLFWITIGEFTLTLIHILLNSHSTFLVLVDFWGAVANIRFRLKMDSHGLRNWERAIFVVGMAISVILFDSLSSYGPPEYEDQFLATKYTGAGVIVILMLLRATVFISSIARELYKMPDGTAAASQRTMAFQLSFKFAVFVVVVLSFAVYLLNEASIFSKEDRSTTWLMVNRSCTFSVAQTQYLYLFGSLAVLLQFSNINCLFSPLEQTRTVSEPGSASSSNSRKKGLVSGEAAVAPYNEVVGATERSAQVHNEATREEPALSEP